MNRARSPFRLAVVARVAGGAGLLALLAAACSAPVDPLGIDRRRVDAPVMGSPEASIAQQEAEEPDASPPPETSAPVDASPPPDAAPVETALGDLLLDVVANGHGPLEKNASNGEVNAGDGLPITLAGVVYPKGLGVHAPSEVNVPLGGAYKTFLADVGVDDEVMNLGSVVFKVMLDGVEVYDSGLLTGASATKKVTVDVTGKQQLKLVVTNGGDDTSYDHADWAAARLVK